jgi:hypothetical protein
VSASDLRPRCVLSWNLGTPLWVARTPYGGGGFWTNIGGPDCISRGPTLFPWGSGFSVDTLEYITFSGHVAALDPPMWWGQALL